MNEFLKILLNIRSLRAALRELSFEQLVEVKEKLDEVLLSVSNKKTKSRPSPLNACKSWLSSPKC